MTRADLIAINRGLSSQIESMEDATEEQVAPFKRALRKARDRLATLTQRGNRKAIASANARAEA